MSSTLVMDVADVADVTDLADIAGRPPVTWRRLRPLLGSPVTIRTVSRTLRGTLLSSVRDSVWLVVDDADVLVHVDEIVAVQPESSGN